MKYYLLHSLTMRITIIPKLRLFNTIIIFTMLLCGCYQSAHNDKKDSPFKKTLLQKKVNGINFFISLPANYVIKEHRVPDFSVYYFHPTDTSIKNPLRGGFYLGNSPGESGPENDSCKEEKITSLFLEKDMEWTVYNCNNTYKIQLITKSESGYNWAVFIHAFGNASSKVELNNLLEVFSTLRK
jgi:hypothetical protein